LVEDSLARIAAVAADEKAATDIVVLDVREQTTIADTFVLCTAETPVQIRAVADNVEAKMKEAGARTLRREGTERARWVLLDFGGVVVHVFGPEERAYYRLERLWSGETPSSVPRKVSDARLRSRRDGG
jgi:ribosome-associated protein